MGCLAGQLLTSVHMGTCWLSAGACRTHVRQVSHCPISSSHREFAHPSWIAGMKLILDLLLGARKHRYLRRCLVDPRPAQVHVRGFSAGSYSGICLLHLLWNMPQAALPVPRHCYMESGIITLPSPSGDVSDHAAGCVFGYRGFCHSHGRAVLTHDTKKLYNDSTVHLVCSNYWVQPIYQELLHSSSRYNATREGERKRPSSGLARVAAHPRPPKKRKPSASGTSFSDWIGGTCYADTLQVCFRPTGPQWCYNSCNRRRIAIVLKTRLGWTKRRLLRIFAAV